MRLNTVTRLAAFALLVLGADTTQAARIANLAVAETTEGIVLTYDLESKRPVRVRLVGSDDEGESWDMRVRAVSGDVGKGVTPGARKRIVWEASRDYPGGFGDVDILLDVIAVDEAPAQADGPRPSGPVYFVIPFRGEVGKEIRHAVLSQALAEAARLEPQAVVFEVDSPGGLIAELNQLLEMVSDWQRDHPGVEVVAWIPQRAMSAAAIFSMACRRIYLQPGAVIGAAMAINVRGGRVSAVHEKFASAYRGRARAAVELAGHEPLLADAMIDPDVSLSLVWDAGGSASVVRGDPSGPAGDTTAAPRLLVERGKLLTLTSSEALEAGLAQGVVADYRELGTALGFDGWNEYGGAGRRLVEEWETTVDRVVTDYDDLVYTIRETIDKLRTSSGRQLAALEANIWEVRSSVDEIEQMARDYPFIATRVARNFTGGTGNLKDQCDQALQKIRDFRRERTRARRNR